MQINSVMSRGYNLKALLWDKKFTVADKSDKLLFAGETTKKNIFPAIFLAAGMIPSLLTGLNSKTTEAGFISPSKSSQEQKSSGYSNNISNADIIPTVPPAAPSNNEFQEAMEKAQTNYYITTLGLSEGVHSDLEKFGKKENLELIKIEDNGNSYTEEKAKLNEFKIQFLSQMSELEKTKTDLEKKGIDSGYMQNNEAYRKLDFETKHQIAKYSVKVFQARLTKNFMLNLMWDTKQPLAGKLRILIQDTEAHEQLLGRNQAEAENNLMRFFQQGAGHLPSTDERQPLPEKRFTPAQPTEETRKALYAAEKELAATNLEGHHMHEYYLQIIAEKSNQLEAYSPENKEHFDLIKQDFLSYIENVKQNRQALDKANISPDSLRSIDPYKKIDMATEKLISVYTNSIKGSEFRLMKLLDLATGQDKYPLPRDIEATLFDNNAASFLLGMLQGQAAQNLRDAKIKNGDMTPDGVELFKGNKTELPKLIW